ncbi:class I glutamine amidotransferase-like protein [Tothia fuscella]|uniref:Class I glutamine amidotransferase-like protein n=1 Tax=Tothia fuscella TaxID=1048955 RepID=A0A9P4NJI5_9PEZI|nr:class I glutamine amidotransferase-like protein [Tothia fuscella]
MILFRGFEPLDVFGPLEALQTLSLWFHLELTLISENSTDPVSTAPILASMNRQNSSFFQTIVPTATHDTAPKDLEVLIIPGGAGSRSPYLNSTLDYIRDSYPNLNYLLTVCTGSLIAGRSGILDGKRATTNKLAFLSVQSAVPNVKWQSHARWVVDGNIWTSSGVSAGIDMTLEFIECWYGKKIATNVTNFIEYERHTDPRWDPFADIVGLPDPNESLVVQHR